MCFWIVEGLKKAFTNFANFNRIGDAPIIKITDAVHKAFINVHEGGTEAAAATGIGIYATSAPKVFFVIRRYFKYL